MEQPADQDRTRQGNDSRIQMASAQDEVFVGESHMQVYVRFTFWVHPVIFPVMAMTSCRLQMFRLQRLISPISLIPASVVSVSLMKTHREGTAGSDDVQG